MIENLRNDIKRINRYVRTIKGEALSELMSLEQREKTDLGAVLNSVFSRVAKDFPKVTINNGEVRGMSPFVSGGHVSLERILFNLLMNSCEGDGTSTASRIEVTVSLASPGDQVIIAITDDGPGLPPEMLRSREDVPILSRKDGGTGIGLLTVRTLLAASGGKLHLKNGYHAGAVATIELPLNGID